MSLFGLKNCDTCRKALKTLPEATFFDVREAGVPDAVMARAFAQFGDTLLNTRSTTWRGLDADERNAPPLELLAAHPTLIKRPLIQIGDALFLGWTAQTQAAVQATL
ncbi:ArsC/Spx/MgsR family protein [Sulfitobacter sp.]|uniref:ArsC/Spx/MgsR family protein n=1 Tax=Sulfitobacter sp. TaxID=1903071 RepID=UPI003001BC08